MRKFGKAVIFGVAAGAAGHAVYKFLSDQKLQVKICVGADVAVNTAKDVAKAVCGKYESPIFEDDKDNKTIGDRLWGIKEALLNNIDFAIEEFKLIDELYDLDDDPDIDDIIGDDLDDEDDENLVDDDFEDNLEEESFFDRLEAKLGVQVRDAYIKVTPDHEEMLDNYLDGKNDIDEFDCVDSEDVFDDQDDEVFDTESIVDDDTEIFDEIEEYSLEQDAVLEQEDADLSVENESNEIFDELEEQSLEQDIVLEQEDAEVFVEAEGNEIFEQLLEEAIQGDSDEEPGETREPNETGEE